MSNTSPVQHKVTSREIWALTWPQAIMMLMQFLVGFTDVVVAGRIHPHVQAVFGLITQCQFFLLVIAIAISNGGIAAMSQALGAGLEMRAKRYVGLIFSVAIAFCFFVVTIAFFFRTSIFVLLQVPPDLLPLTNELWVLLLAVIPSNYLLSVSIAIFRAHKNVRIPLITGTLMCIVNAIGDLGLGLGYFGMPHLGAKGLVIATVASVTAGAAFNIYILIRDRVLSRNSFAPWRWQKKALPYLIKVALPSGANQLLWQLGYLVLFFITSTLPTDEVNALAGLTAGMRVEGILFLPGLAFSFTGSVLVGRSLGAGDKMEARRIGLRVAIAGTLCMSIVALCLFPLVDPIAAFVAPDPGVQAAAKSYINYNLLATPFTVTSMIMTGILTGAGASLYPMAVNSLATWMVRLPVAWYMGHVIWQNASGVFLAMLISQFIQALGFYYVFLRCNWYRFASTAKRFNRE